MENINNMAHVIETVFQTENIYKSVIITRDVRTMYHLEHILKLQLYPVSILGEYNFYDVIDRFAKGNLRILILSEVMFYLLQSRWSSLADDVKVIFLCHDAHIPTKLDAQVKIISLSI
jgi:hypothetical protein